jgi:hypothetical protein
MATATFAIRVGLFGRRSAIKGVAEYAQITGVEVDCERAGSVIRFTARGSDRAVRVFMAAMRRSPLQFVDAA